MGIKGQKIHPVGWRIGFYRKWKSLWFQDSSHYGKYLIKTLKVEQLIESFLAFNLKPSIGCNIQIISQSTEKSMIFVYFYQLRYSKNIANKRLTHLLKSNSYRHLFLGWKKSSSIKTRNIQLMNKSFSFKNNIALQKETFNPKMVQRFIYFYLKKINNYYKQSFSQIFFLDKEFLNFFSKGNLIYIFYLKYYLFGNFKNNVLFNSIFQFEYSLFFNLQSYILTALNVQKEANQLYFPTLFINLNKNKESSNLFNTVIKKKILKFRKSFLWTNKNLLKLENNTKSFLLKRRFLRVEQRILKARFNTIKKLLTNLHINCQNFYLENIFKSPLFYKSLKWVLNIRKFLDSFLKYILFLKKQQNKEQMSSLITKYLSKNNLFSVRIRGRLTKKTKGYLMKKKISSIKYSQYYKFLIRRDLKLFDKSLMYTFKDLEVSLSLLLNQKINLFFINTMSLMYHKTRLLEWKTQQKEHSNLAKMLKDEKKKNKAALSMLKVYPKTIIQKSKQKNLLIHDFVLLTFICVSLRQLKPLVRFIGYQIKLLGKGRRQIPIIRYFMKLLIRLAWIFTKLKGLRIQFKGRFDRWRRTKSLVSFAGQLPVQTMSSDIEFASTKGLNKKGTFGIRLWIYYDKQFHQDYMNLIKTYWNYY